MMNRVSECKEKKPVDEPKRAAVGSIWTNSGYYHFMVTSKDGKYVCLEDGKFYSTIYDFASSYQYRQIYCVTIERDSDE